MTEAVIRIGDWEAALASYIAGCRELPFKWGTHDCALFMAGAVQAMTGFDPAERYRHTYSDRVGAMRALRMFGPGTLEGQLDAFFPRIAPAFARRGDLAWYDGSVGVVLGPFAAFVGEQEGTEGLLRVSRADWEGAWSVG